MQDDVLGEEGGTQIRGDHSGAALYFGHCIGVRVPLRRLLMASAGVGAMGSGR